MDNVKFKTLTMNSIRTESLPVSINSKNCSPHPGITPHNSFLQPSFLNSNEKNVEKMLIQTKHQLKKIN